MFGSRKRIAALEGRLAAMGLAVAATADLALTGAQRRDLATLLRFYADGTKTLDSAFNRGRSEGLRTLADMLDAEREDG